MEKAKRRQLAVLTELYLDLKPGEAEEQAMRRFRAIMGQVGKEISAGTPFRMRVYEMESNKWTTTAQCPVCSKFVTVFAGSLSDADIRYQSEGWIYSDEAGGYVCPDCQTGEPTNNTGHPQL